MSPACDHCYAEAQEDARYGRVEWGGPRRRTSEATRRAPYRWDREVATAGERRQVFCMSLGDFWDNQVPDEWRTEALNTIRQCRNLDWLILTKRKMLPPDWGPLGWSQVWLGKTVENMTEARRRMPILLRLPARVHWLSALSPAPPRRPCRRSLDLRRSLLLCLDLTFEECPLMGIDGASDSVVRLAIFHRK